MLLLFIIAANILLISKMAIKSNLDSRLKENKFLFVQNYLKITSFFSIKSHN